MCLKIIVEGAKQDTLRGAGGAAGARPLKVWRRHHDCWGRWGCRGHARRTGPLRAPGVRKVSQKYRGRCHMYNTSQGARDA